MCTFVFLISFGGFSIGPPASTTKPSSSNGLTPLTAAPTTSVQPAFGTTTLTRDDNSEVTGSSETREPRPQFTFLGEPPFTQSSFVKDPNKYEKPLTSQVLCFTTLL